jgi:prefoldin subunit 4
MNPSKLAEEEENEDANEVTWGAFFDNSTFKISVDRVLSEDQQRINTFSKLNTRLRSIEERLEELKVCWQTRHLFKLMVVSSKRRKH